MITIQEFAKKFYKSKAWLDCRDAYIAGLKDKTCPRCKQNPGKIVHHKILLTEENIDNPMITLNPKHFEYLCQDCHTKEHLKKGATKEGLQFDEDGNLIKVKSPPQNH